MTRTLLDDARAELHRARTTAQKDDYILAQRQAAEKAWGYMVERTDAILGLRRTVDEEYVHQMRAEKLEELQLRLGEPLYQDYRELARELHGRCFYEGRVDLTKVEGLVEAAARFPERVREAQRRAWSR